MGIILFQADIVTKLLATCFMFIADTDDDFPPTYSNSRGVRGSGRGGGNGRAAVAANSYHREPTDMEAQIRHLEQEAYCSVLRAFKAQSDAITWVGIINPSFSSF
jgi:hypothetical protein